VEESDEKEGKGDEERCPRPTGRSQYEKKSNNGTLTPRDHLSPRDSTRLTIDTDLSQISKNRCGEGSAGGRCEGLAVGHLFQNLTSMKTLDDWK
jgi:hypothetical protein